MVLDLKEKEAKAVHSDKVGAWIDSGEIGNCPTRDEPPLSLLFEMFNDIFPLIEASFDSTNRQIYVIKDDYKYRPSMLSDGEKQVFSILADFFNIPANFKYIIVDEPELNLHPELAERLWSFLENKYPDKIFIYATPLLSH